MTDSLEPDVNPPASSSELTTGWVFNTYSRRVEAACSSSIHHSIGRTDKTTSQSPIKMFSSKKRALLALRAALAKEFAFELKKIDALIKAEKAR